MILKAPFALLVSALILAAAPALAATPFPKATRAGPPNFEVKDPLAEAVQAPSRAPESITRDAWRHPLESLTFWGVQPGDTILELSPGNGYWTEILAPFAKSTGGRYVGAGPDIDAPDATPRAQQARTAFEAKFQVKTVGLSKTSGPLAPPGTVDFILTARNIHNWIWSGLLDKVMADSFAALKPGGVLAIEEHRADPRPMVSEARDGYVSEAYVIAAAQKAGFRLDGRSEINANPKDSKDHPFGVWTLPPVLQTSERGKPADPNFDTARYRAIGESDRMTLRFRKPG